MKTAKESFSSFVTPTLLPPSKTKALFQNRELRAASSSLICSDMTWPESICRSSEQVIYGSNLFVYEKEEDISLRWKKAQVTILTYDAEKTRTFLRL